MRCEAGKRACKSGTCPDVDATPHDSGGVPPAASVRRGTRWADTGRVPEGRSKRPSGLGTWFAERTRFPSFALLLELDRGAGLFELRLDLVGLLLVHALLHGLGGRVDQILGLL